MSLDWMRAGTALFLRTVDALTDPQYGEPSGLPGWSRAHVVAHVHFNALALGRLVEWAATGVEHRMYPSPEARNAEIEEGARLSPSELNAMVHASSIDVIAAYEALDADALTVTVRTAHGRPLPAADIAWLRARETAVHTVDLASTVTWSDLPPDLTLAIATEALQDQEQHAPALAAYLTGRSAAAPSLDPWL
jgi:maleylpyruvate isomerase